MNEVAVYRDLSMECAWLFEDYQMIPSLDYRRKSKSVVIQLYVSFS